MQRPRAPITVILLNYKRPQNIPIVLESIKKQTIQPQVFLWNNGKEKFDPTTIDSYHESECNLGCMARWRLAKKAQTPYVMSLDDDRRFAREDSLERVVEALDKLKRKDSILGIAGVRLSAKGTYQTGARINAKLRCAGEDRTKRLFEWGLPPLRTFIPVDIVLGQMMALRTQFLREIELPDEREDDIFLCARVSGRKRLHHRVARSFDYLFESLPEYGVASFQEKGHFESRERAVRRYFA